MMSAETHGSDDSGTFVTADWGLASPRVRTKSFGRNSSVAPASIAESTTSSHPSQSSLYASAQSMHLDSVDRPSQLLQTLPEDSGEGPGTPSQVLEPEVPDPFIIEGSEGALSEGEDDAEAASPGGESIPPADEEIALAQSAVLTPSEPPLMPSPNVNKDVPPPPASDAESEAPELYLPGLTMPTMFLPIPNTDPLNILLTKYVSPLEKRPVRDVTGEWQDSDFHSMVMTNSWRSLARMARDRLVSCNPADLILVLDLWSLRLSSLARLRLYNQTSAECTNLFAVLNAIEPPSARAYLFDHVLPFELEVMHARLKYWAGDPMGYLDILYALLKKCKLRARSSKSEGDDTSLSMWLERAARMCLIIASQMIEMKDFTAATKLLEPLFAQRTGQQPSPAIRSAVGRIYLQSGYLTQAAAHFAAVDGDAGAPQTLKDMNAALLACAEGNWTRADELLRALVQAEPDNFVAINNLSVALLSQGKLKEGIEVLEAALHSSPSAVVVAEPYLFNLSTLYELHSATAVEKKRDLLIEVAKWSGDGLKTTCLKMPST
jgi:tetratricopeptide (TPR) repeat protein